jgi:hypothetical protein
MPRDGLEYAGGRRFLRVVMSLEAIAMGWYAFIRIQKECRNWGVDPDELEHRYTEDNYGQMIAVFEVVPRVRG